MSHPAKAPLLMSGGPKAAVAACLTPCCKGKSYGVKLIDELKAKNFEIPEMDAATAQTKGATFVANIFVQFVSEQSKQDLLVSQLTKWKGMLGEYIPAATPCDAKTVGFEYLAVNMVDVKHEQIPLDLGAEFASAAVKQYLAANPGALERAAVELNPQWTSPEKNSLQFK